MRWRVLVLGTHTPNVKLLAQSCEPANWCLKRGPANHQPQRLNKVQRAYFFTKFGYFSITPKGLQTRVEDLKEPMVIKVCRSVGPSVRSTNIDHSPLTTRNQTFYLSPGTQRDVGAKAEGDSSTTLLDDRWYEWIRLFYDLRRLFY